MAYTKIHAIKATVNKAIAYITNPEKTDEKMLVDFFACSPESADIEFDFALKKTISAGPNKAYHLIQSFMPGEVSYDEAHAMLLLFGLVYTNILEYYSSGKNCEYL